LASPIGKLPLIKMEGKTLLLEPKASIKPFWRNMDTPKEVIRASMGGKSRRGRKAINSTKIPNRAQPIAEIENIKRRLKKRFEDKKVNLAMIKVVAIPIYAPTIDISP
jgi:hypothetical protein